MKVKLLLFLPCFFFVISTAFAQGVVSGTVFTADGKPLAGATVTIEKLTLSTVTTIDGAYKITIPANSTNESSYTVLAMYVGYITASSERVSSSGNSTINFVLNENFLSLKGIEVTGLKNQSVLEDQAPASVTVFKGSFIDHIGANSLSSFVQMAPGVSTTQIDEGYTAFQIRGISTFSGDSPAGYYLDNAPLTFISSPLVPDINPFDLKQVEILRGPQGTLYGNGGESGVVRVLTNDANLSKVELKADITGAITSQGGPDHSFQGAVNLPVIKDMLAIRLTGGYLNQGGFLTNNLLNQKNINGNRLGYFRGKVNFAPTDRLSIKASFWTQKDDISSNSLADKNFDHSTPYPEANNNDMKLYDATIEYKFPQVHLYSATAYSNFNAVQNDGSSIFALSGSTLGQKAFSEELRANSTYNGHFNWLAGMYYWDGTFNQTTNISYTLPGIGLTTIPYLGTTAHSKQISGFGELHYKFLDNKMQATAGLRYFSEQRNLQDLVPSTVTFLQMLGIPARRGTNYKIFAPKFNLSYNVSKNALLYATAANGFRSGFVQSGAFYSSAVAFGAPAPEYVQKENLWSYELGTKLTSANNQFVVEAATYYNHWTSLIQTTQQVFIVGGVPTPVIYFLNAGKAGALGIDLTTQYINPMGLTLTLGGNINKSQYLEDTPPSVGAKKGDQISFVPKYTLSSSVYYSHAISKGVTGSVLADIQRSAQRVDYANGVQVHGDNITILNARAGVNVKNWGVFLYGNNLTNDRGATYPSTALTYYTRLRPRTLGIDLKINY